MTLHITVVIFISILYNLCCKVERLLQANKPMALGRVMQAMGDKMDSNQLLDKIKQTGGMNDVIYLLLLERKLSVMSLVKMFTKC